MRVDFGSLVKKWRYGFDRGCMLSLLALLLSSALPAHGADMRRSLLRKEGSDSRWDILRHMLWHSAGPDNDEYFFPYECFALNMHKSDSPLLASHFTKIIIAKFPGDGSLESVLQDRYKRHPLNMRDLVPDVILPNLTKESLQKSFDFALVDRIIYGAYCAVQQVLTDFKSCSMEDKLTAVVAVDYALHALPLHPQLKTSIFQEQLLPVLQQWQARLCCKLGSHKKKEDNLLIGLLSKRLFPLLSMKVPSGFPDDLFDLMTSLIDLTGTQKRLWQCIAAAAVPSSPFTTLLQNDVYVTSWRSWYDYSPHTALPVFKALLKARFYATAELMVLYEGANAVLIQLILQDPYTLDEYTKHIEQVFSY